jgi:hypothetical protein
MGSLKDNFGERSRGARLSGIDLLDFECQCITDVQIYVWKAGFLPAPRVRQLNRIKRLAVVGEPDPLDAPKIPEAALWVDAGAMSIP